MSGFLGRPGLEAKARNYAKIVRTFGIVAPSSARSGDSEYSTPDNRTDKCDRCNENALNNNLRMGGIRISGIQHLNPPDGTSKKCVSVSVGIVRGRSSRQSWGDAREDENTTT